MRSKARFANRNPHGRRLYAAASLFFFWLAAHPASAADVERRLSAMGTSLTIELEAPTRAEALAASEAAVRAIEAAERRLSTWVPGSELSRLNDAPPSTMFAVSEALATELSAAQSCAAKTGGAFDPTVGRLVTAWDLRGNGRRPTAAEITRARTKMGHERFTVEAGGITKEADFIFEEGGFGKGAGLSSAMQVLAAQPVSAAVVGLGGQFASTHEWEVSLAHPRNRSETVLRLLLPAGSFATSGNSEKAKRAGGERIGHILDARTGYPAKEFGSMGVWSADPLLADCLSTGLYVMGPQDALSWAAPEKAVGIVVIEAKDEDAGVRVRLSPTLKKRIIWQAATTEIIE